MTLGTDCWAERNPSDADNQGATYDDLDQIPLKVLKVTREGDSKNRSYSISVSGSKVISRLICSSSAGAAGAELNMTDFTRAFKINDLTRLPRHHSRSSFVAGQIEGSAKRRRSNLGEKIGAKIEIYFDEGLNELRFKPNSTPNAHVARSVW